MPVSFLENAYFLQSIGWAISSSFWQAGVLWLVYKVMISNNSRLSALVKYNFSLSFLFAAFAWFVVTAIQNYLALAQASIPFAGITIVMFGPIYRALPFLAITYFVLLAFYGIKFFLHYFRLQIVSSKGLQKAPLDIRLFVDSTAHHLGIKKKIRVWLSNHIDVPSVAGFFKPVILLPAAIINNLSVAQVNAVLVHELAHIKRNDFIVNLLQSLVTLTLFFNPFAMFLCKAARKERENCCDDQVLNYQFDRLAYAKALVLLEEHRHQTLNLALAATNSKRLLTHRIKRLLTLNDTAASTRLNQKWQLVGLWLLLLAGICVLVPFFAGNPSNYNKTNVGIDKTWSIPAKIFYENAFVKQEGPTTIIHNKTTITKAQAQRSGTVSLPVKKIPGKTPEKSYLLALVNEDVLRNVPGKEAVTLVADKGKANLPSVLVKIEDQQSGKKQTNTYYFNLKEDKDGKMNVLPLLLLRNYNLPQILATGKKLIKAKLSLHLAPHKRRVTA